MADTDMLVDNLDSETHQKALDLGHVILSPEAKDLVDQHDISLTKLIELYANQRYGVIESDAEIKNDTAIRSQEGECRAVYPLSETEGLVVKTQFKVTVTQILSLDEEKHDL